MKNVDLILCADFHWREDVPLCRTDDYRAAQNRKCLWLKNLQIEYNCPVVIAGDVFDDWKPSALNNGYNLLSSIIDIFPKDVIAIPGQHDLPNHNLELYKKSPLAVLERTNGVVVLTTMEVFIKRSTFSIYGFPWGAVLSTIPVPLGKGYRRVALIHTLVLGPKDKNIPGTSAMEIFNRMPGFDLIVAGDNHQSFVVKHEGRLLVNPGSMMRMKADQIEHKPCVYLWNAKTNTVVPEYFPIEPNVVSREHIEIKENENTRMKDLTDRLHREGVTITASFTDTMKQYLQKNKVKKTIEHLIYKAMKK